MDAGSTTGIFPTPRRIPCKCAEIDSHLATKEMTQTFTESPMHCLNTNGLIEPK